MLLLAHVLHYPLLATENCQESGEGRMCAIVFPRSVKCEDCGQIAMVRGYGRIEYRWPETTKVGPEATTPTIDCIRLTIDCPRCGVKSQEFFPDESSPAARRFKHSTANCNAFDRRREVRLRQIGPLNRAL
jgi:hypothetical protein